MLGTGAYAITPASARKLISLYNGYFAQSDIMMYYIFSSELYIESVHPAPFCQRNNAEGLPWMEMQKSLIGHPEPKKERKSQFKKITDEARRSYDKLARKLSGEIRIREKCNIYRDS
jgi:hypothetical protein